MKLTFIKTGINGEGIARHNGKLVFCNDVFPEETAIVIAVQEEKNYIRAKLDTLLQTAAFRRPNPCPYAQACGGCALLAMQDARQIFQKEELLQEVMEIWPYKIFHDQKNAPFCTNIALSQSAETAGS